MTNTPTTNFESPFRATDDSYKEQALFYVEYFSNGKLDTLVEEFAETCFGRQQAKKDLEEFKWTMKADILWNLWYLQNQHEWDRIGLYLKAHWIHSTYKEIFEGADLALKQKLMVEKLGFKDRVMKLLSMITK